MSMNGHRVLSLHRPRCVFCKREKASMVQVESKAICGVCINEFSKTSGRDRARMRMALWLIAFRFYKQEEDGTWVPACDPGELAIAATAVELFADTLLELQ